MILIDKHFSNCAFLDGMKAFVQFLPKEILIAQAETWFLCSDILPVSADVNCLILNLGVEEVIF